MSDLNLTESDPVPADFEGDAFDEWIGGATVSKRSVPIYGKPGLFAEYEDLERQREKAVDEQKGGAELGGSGIVAIDERLAEIYEEWMASKSTWTVRALDEDEIKAVGATVDEAIGEEPVEPKPEHPKPADLPKNHSDQQAKSHTIKMQAYEAAKPAHDAALKVYAEAHKAYIDELNFHLIAAAVERIEFANGRVQSEITVEQLRALKKRLGERQLMSLLNAAQLAIYVEPEIPAPFSNRDSEDDPT